VTCPMHKLPAILPERFADPQLINIPAAQLCLFCADRSHHNELRRYSVFDRIKHHTVRKASYQWSLSDYVTDAVQQAAEEIQVVQVLAPPLPALPEPQVSLTPAGLGPGELVLPVDCRSLGGPVVAIAMRPEQDISSIFTEVASLLPHLAPTLHMACSMDGVYAQDSSGRIWDMLPRDLSSLQWLVLRVDHSVLPGLLSAPLGMPQLAQLAPTTSTTTGAFSTTDRGVTVTFALAGGGTVIRLVPQPILTAQVRDSLAELLFILALQGRVPERPVVSLSTAAPRDASQPRNRQIIFLIYSADDIGRDVHMLQDSSQDGSLLQEMTLDAGALAGELISEAHRRRNFLAALNGVPHVAANRPLITGDLVQLQQAPLTVRVTPITASFDDLPELRYFMTPVRVPHMRGISADPAAA